MPTNASTSDSKPQESAEFQMWLMATKELFIRRKRLQNFALFIAFVGADLFRSRLSMVDLAAKADPLFIWALLGGAVALVVATSFVVSRMAQRTR